MGDVILFVDELCKTSYCRICHEAEFESCKTLETPCACSGTAKFAHRDCIQRWCDEKGDTICEICLQKYEPNYTAIPKQPKNIVVRDEVVSIRGSLEIPRAVREIPDSELLAIAECSTTAHRTASCCKILALIFTALLLVSHLYDLLIIDGARHYPFSLLTVVLLRASGIIIPMFIIFQTITALQNSIRRHGVLHETLMSNASNRGEDEEQVHDRSSIIIS